METTLETAIRYRDAVIGRLVAEGAMSLTDAEIERCTGRCVSAKVGAWARLLRDNGRLTAADIAHTTDADCERFIDAETAVCRVCGVGHGEACAECKGTGFHAAGCEVIA